MVFLMVCLGSSLDTHVACIMGAPFWFVGDMAVYLDTLILVPQTPVTSPQLFSCLHGSSCELTLDTPCPTSRKR